MTDVYMIDATSNEVFKITSNKLTDLECIEDVRGRLKAVGLPLTIHQSLVISATGMPNMAKRAEVLSVINAPVFER